MIIEIPFKTPSVNHLYFNWQNRRILTKEARNLKKEIKEIVDKSFFKKESLEGEELEVEVEIYENWYTKKNKVKRKDISNREKFLIDAVFDVLGLEDKFIFKHTMKKIQSQTEKAIINIRRSHE
jgi:Holliday junction resolvase RusA-like endonuclease